MARPTIFKKGPMTAAERQRRRRKKLAAAERKDKAAAAKVRRLERHGKLAVPEEFPTQLWCDAYQRARADLFAEFFEQEPLFDPEGEADKVATQIAEWLQMSEITIADVRAALDRRFGAECMVKAVAGKQRLPINPEHLGGSSPKAEPRIKREMA